MHGPINIRMTVVSPAEGRGYDNEWTMTTVSPVESVGYDCNELINLSQYQILLIECSCDKIKSNWWTGQYVHTKN